MKKLMVSAGAVALAAMVAGCASTRIDEKVSTWQNERPCAEKIKAVRDSGRKLRSSDVDLVFTMEDFKKELPECAVSLDAVLALAKSALNIVSELGNTTSPLYVAAVNSVDRKWAMYIGRDVEANAGGDIEKYLASIPEDRRDLARKDYDAYQKIVKYVPAPAQLAKGQKVYERHLVTGENGEKVLDVMAIEMLPYTGKPGDAEDYSAFLVFRDNSPEAQKAYDSAILVKLNALAAKLQVQLNDMLDAVQKLSQDPEVSKLSFMDLGLTLKAVGVGIKDAFADPMCKIGSAIRGYSIAGDIDELAKETQQVEQSEADKAKKD